MSRGPLLDEVHAAIQIGLAALEAQMAAMRQAHAGRLKPGQRRDMRAVIDGLARRIVAWQEIAEPELVARLEAIGERVRALQTGRRGCSRGRGRCSGSCGPHRTEER